jgi:hypothetical protein
MITDYSLLSLCQAGVIAVLSSFMLYNSINITSGCVASANRLIVNEELKVILMEVVVVSFEILFRPYFRRYLVKNNEYLQSEYPVFGPRFEPETSECEAGVLNALCSIVAVGNDQSV